MNEIIDNFLRFDELIQIFRIFLAILLGACIGFEREKYGRPAGLRTHMLVCVASALAMLISIYAFDSGDPARLAAQVISGIGFIGAGTIIRGDKDITGITTASTIFICAIIGLSAGSGYYFGAIITTILALVILSCFTSIELKLSQGRKHRSSLSVVLKREDDVVEKFKGFLSDENLALSMFEYKSTTLDGEKVYKLNVSFEKYIKLSDLNNFLSKLDKEFDPIQCKLSNDVHSKSRHIKE